MNLDNISTVQMPTRASSTIAHTDKASRGQSETQAASAEKTQDRKTPELSLQDAVKRLSEFVSQSSSEINFSIDEESGINIVKVTDSKTKEVIRQFPSEEVIAIARALDKLQGLFIKDKA